MKYRKGENSAIDADFNAAPWYGNVRLGNTYLFYKKMLQWYCLPFELVERLYRRVEEVKSRTGCCSNDFSIHKLIVVQKDGTELTIKIGEAMYRHEPEQLMDAIREQHSEIPCGIA